MRQQDFDACGLTSWKPIVREVLAEWERQRGIRLEWIAAEHMTPGHPHCHVDIKAVYQDGRGRPQLLRLDRTSLLEIKECTRRVLEREREQYQRQRQLERELARARAQVERTLGQLGTVLLLELEPAAEEQDRDGAEDWRREHERQRRKNRGRDRGRGR